MEGGLGGKRVLVVGASAGIGRAIAQSALRRGASVALAARRADRLDAAIGNDPRGVAIRADVRDPADCDRIAEAAVSAFGQLDLVVYAAGVSPLLPAHAVTRNDWTRALDINTIGASLVFRACIPHVERDGMLAYLSSDSVGKPRHGGLIYQATKAATEEVLRVLRAEHTDRRFVNVIVGATVGTEIAIDRDPSVMDALAREWVKRGLFHSGFMHAEALGELIVAMLTPALRYPAANLTELKIEAGGPLLENFELLTTQRAVESAS